MIDKWLIYILGFVILAALGEIFQKRALEEEHTLEFLVIRGFFTTPILLLLIPFFKVNITFQGVLLSAVVAVLAAAGILYRNRALKHTDISIVQPLMNTQPVFVLIVAFIFLGEKVTPIQLLAIFLIVLGTYILENDHTHHGFLGPLKKIKESKYALFVLSAMAIFGITNTLDRFILTNHFTPITYLIVVTIMVNFVFLGWHAYQYKLNNIGTVFKKQGLKILVPAVLTILATLAFYNAMALAAAGLVVAVSRLQSVITTIEGGKFFHEKYLARKTIACLITGIGAALVVI